jgi:hypothetical protein
MFMVYKLMANEFFLTHSFLGITILYKTLGKRFTNALVNMTAGQIFTSGETLKSLVKDMKELEKTSVRSICNYVVEGQKLNNSSEDFFGKTVKDLVDSINYLTADKQDGNMSIKFTALMPKEIFLKLSEAQILFTSQVLGFNGRDPITKA